MPVSSQKVRERLVEDVKKSERTRCKMNNLRFRGMNRRRCWALKTKKGVAMQERRYKSRRSPQEGAAGVNEKEHECLGFRGGESLGKKLAGRRQTGGVGPKNSEA